MVNSVGSRYVTPIGESLPAGSASSEGALAAMRLENISAVGAEWVPAENVLHIGHPHGLAQAIGYLKYTGGNSSEQILFRGQAAIYPKMLPSIYRPSTRLPAVRKEKADEEVNSFLRECQRVEPFIRGTPRESFEPLLQHYGMRTRWLDVVDNIWVALWFACHDIVVDGVERQYWSIERRSRSRGGAFAYIVLFAFRDLSEHRPLPGHMRGPNYRIVDLRVAAPSLYFRPHAQHGFLSAGRGSLPRLRNPLRLDRRRAPD